MGKPRGGRDRDRSASRDRGGAGDGKPRDDGVWTCDACGGWSWWSKKSCHECGEAKPRGAKKEAKKVRISSSSRAPSRDRGDGDRGKDAELKRLAAELAETKKQLKMAGSASGSTASAESLMGDDEAADPLQEISMDDLRGLIKGMEALKSSDAAHTNLLAQYKNALRLREREGTDAKPTWVVARRLQDRAAKARKTITRNEERIAEIDVELEVLATEKSECIHALDDGRAALEAVEQELAQLHLNRARLPPKLAATFDAVDAALLKEPELQRVESVSVQVYQAAARAAAMRVQRAREFGFAEKPDPTAGSAAEAKLGGEVAELERQLGQLCGKFQGEFESLQQRQEDAVSNMALLQKARLAPAAPPVAAASAAPTPTSAAAAPAVPTAATVAGGVAAGGPAASNAAMVDATPVG